MSGSAMDRDITVRLRSQESSNFFENLNVRSKLLRRRAGAQDFGASVSRPRSASSETAVLGNSFLSFS